MRLATLLLALCTAALGAQTPSAGHRIVRPDEIRWGPTQNGLATAIVEGDRAQPGPFTMMLRLEDGAWIPPHFHNVEKRLIVVAGELLMGHGDTIVPAQVRSLPAGGMAVMPANTNHYEGGRGLTIVALLANGPFTTTFVKAP